MKIQLNSILVAISLCIFFSTALLVFQSMNAVPYWDSWDSYKGWIEKASKLETTSSFIFSLFDQHNEHRIGLTRLFFLIDHFIFDGKSKFLLLINLLLPLTILLIFFTRLRHNWNLLFFLFLGMVYSYSQADNFNWEFQSQFFMAQYIPFIFYVLILDVFKTASDPTRIGLILVGAALSMFTMANGVLFGGPLILYFLLIERNFRLLAISTSATALVIFVYFSVLSYVEPGGHGTLSDTSSYGFAEILGLAHYVTTYFGNFHQLEAEFIFGLVFITFNFYILFSIFISKNSRNYNFSGLDYAFLLYIAYYVATALVTGIGRFQFGIHQALSERYTTPSLLAWIGVIYIFATIATAQKQTKTLNYLVGFFIFIIALSQVKAIYSFYDKDFNRKQTAMLAMSLNVGGKSLTQAVYPNDARVRGLYASALSRSEPFIIDSSWHRLAQHIGKTEPFELKARCNGHIDTVQRVHGGLILTGWLSGPRSYLDASSSPLSLQAVSENGEVIGVGYRGLRRPDVLKAIGGNSLHSGYRVIIPQSQLNKSEQAKKLHVATIGKDSCGFVDTIDLVSLLVPTKKTNLTPLNLIENRGFVGKDFHKSAFAGETVLGTYVKSDSDTGEIRLEIPSNATLKYRTGPANNGNTNATLLADGQIIKTQPLFSPEWSIYEIDPRLQLDRSKQLVLQLKDEGSGWGEWLAVSLPKP